ncbi:MAG: hypothetical protein WBQ06_01470, partial [Acidobacteriaceae bacterium]
MTQHSTSASAVSITRSQQSHVSTGCARMSRVVLFAAASILTFFFTLSNANGQEPFAPASTQSTAQSSGSVGDGATTATAEDDENSRKDLG